MGPGRFERPTSPLSGVRSNQLSYGPGSPRERTGTAGQGSNDGHDGARPPHSRCGLSWRSDRKGSAGDDALPDCIAMRVQGPPQDDLEDRPPGRETTR